MLIRGETTEDRIAKIAQGFGQGFQNMQQGMDRKRAQDLQAEAARRQQIGQEFEVEAKLSEATGLNYIGSGAGKSYITGNGLSTDLAGTLKSTPKHEREKVTRERENLKFQQDQEKSTYEANQRSLHPTQRDSYIEKAAVAGIKSNAKNGGLSLTKGDESADREYGKNYNNFISKGIVNSESSIKRLEEIANELEKDAGFGEASGTKIPLPDWARSSDAIRRREGAKNAAFSTIKELLPGSVSDSDREAVTRDYYNDQLGAKENAKIIREKIAQLKDIRELEIQKAQHFGVNGTLKGFNGTLSRNQTSQSVNTQQSGAEKAPWKKYGGKK